ncbi:SGNH/GDSL hydrolase family protein [Tumebacillus flagellatus]|uniref:SGNH hydrolase-type esterase domain-containing protein n=1 Tax=Tumebacillus flagellatus TaxID=1157490 RepID=A0A074LSD9_9BACL|nr:SGNH/GDSL hydrolase family protein [Tumebacillus flagellatus]KEO84034.1 hypothetical protein EL26_06095 [Tumebacillus flagellatus]
MKKLLALSLGLLSTLVAADLWAGTFAPETKLGERLVLDDTFYEQNIQLDNAVADLKAKSSPKVIALGDSTMYGSVVYENETIPYFLRQDLQKQLPQATVANLAYPGARPADLYAMLKLTADAHPDLVVVDVNVVFYAQRILDEGALANKTLKREYLFERDVPHGVFAGNRVEEVVQTALKDTNIGQYRTEINKTLFGAEPRQYIRDAVDTISPKPAPAKQPAAAEPIIGVPWTAKTWDDKERATMARIYEQGPLTEQNDSVQMLERFQDYAVSHGIRVLYYLAPQNDTLIGKFFDLGQLHANQDYLKKQLENRGAWFLDLSRAIPASQFGDYDHMLKDGNHRVADLLAAEIEAKGGLRP